MIGNIIAAIVIGIIAGYLGRALLPGDDSMGFVATVVVGIVGALVGYFLFTSLLGIGDTDKFDLGGILGSIVGVMIVLLVLRAVGGSGKGRGSRERRDPPSRGLTARTLARPARPDRSPPSRSRPRWRGGRAAPSPRGGAP